MANSEVVATRRDNIMRRWLRGQSVASIADETGTTLATVKHDISAIRRQLAAEHGDELRLARAALVLSVRDLVQEVWRRIEHLKQQPDGVCDEKTLASYLDAVLRAHTLLAKLTGVSAPPTFEQQRMVNGTVREYLHRQDRQDRQDARDWQHQHPSTPAPRRR